MNYLELFKHYYNDNKESPLDSIFFENKKIPLSKDTKSFSHLLKKNESTKEYIVEVTKSIYFCDNENDGTLFSTKTFPWIKNRKIDKYIKTKGILINNYIFYFINFNIIYD